MPDPIPVEGPVELINGRLVLRIPYEMGGMGVAASALGIGRGDSGHLNVEIPPWLAQKLRIAVGSVVVVSIDTVNGNFSIIRSARNDQSLGQRANTWVLSSSRTPATRWLATLNAIAAPAVVALLAIALRGYLTFTSDMDAQGYKLLTWRVCLPTAAALFGLTATAHWWRWPVRWLLQGLAIAFPIVIVILLRT